MSIPFVKPALRAIEPGLSAIGLGKAYKHRTVLRDVAINVKQGESVALLGPNGAGKTTLFYIMTGLTKPDSGKVLLDGQEITKLPMYRRARLGVGYLPQESSIFRGLNVEENIRLVLEASIHNPQRVEAMLNALLNEFGITHLRYSPSTALSGGERRRLEIARCLASRPKFVLLDEPLAGIDPIAVGEIRKLIGVLKQKNIGVLITDHNVRDTLDIVDRAYILYDGQILTEGTPAEIIRNDQVKRVYLGETFSV